MAAPNSFRLPADVVAHWRDALSAQRAVRGVDPILKEVLDVLLKEGTDGHVIVTRHQLYSWALALEGITTRTATAPQLEATARDMRTYLTGPAPAPAPAPGTTTGTTTATGTSIVPSPSPPPAPLPSPPPSSSPLAQALAQAQAPASSSIHPPPVVYNRGAALPTDPNLVSRLVSERDVGGAVQQIVREARTEILIVAPWSFGFDSLARDVLALPPSVAIRVITRRPVQEDAEYFRVVQELRRRNADVVMTNALHTRMVIADGRRLVLGAAGVVQNGREVAIATTDPVLVAGAREAFARLLEGARSGGGAP